MLATYLDLWRGGRFPLRGLPETVPGCLRARIATASLEETEPLADQPLTLAQMAQLLVFEQEVGPPLNEPNVE